MPRRGISIFRPPQMSIHYLFAREPLTQPGRERGMGALREGLMHQRFIGFCVCALLFGTVSAKANSFFPVVNPGDAFTGSISIDPTTPFAFPSGPPPYLYALPMVNFAWTSPIGAISTNLDGATFSSLITVIAAPVGYGSYSWFEGGGDVGGPPPTLNGASLQSGYLALFLYGSATSTGSILPQPLSSYSCDANCSNVNQAAPHSSELLIAGNSPDGTSSLNLVGFLTSFDQTTSLDGMANFTFSGNICDPTTCPGSPGSISGVPETSTWAMLLIGFAGIEFVSYRRSQKLRTPRR
jgi:hypothetical protein